MRCIPLATGEIVDMKQSLKPIIDLINDKYEISICSTNNYVKCKVKVPVTAKLALEYSKATQLIGTKNNIKQFIYDLSGVQNVDNVIQNYGFIYRDVPNYNLAQNVHIVILTDPNDSSHDFVKAASSNARHFVDFLHDESEAIALFKSE